MTILEENGKEKDSPQDAEGAEQRRKRDFLAKPPGTPR